MKDEPFELEAAQRQLVLNAILDTCRYRNWALLAAHVRTAHVHVVVDVDVPPERIMHDLKSYSSRALNRDRQNWARHGSTRYLYTPESITNAVRYVLEKQGQPMATYLWNPDSNGGDSYCTDNSTPSGLVNPT